MTIRSKVGAAAVTVLAPEAEVAEVGAAKVGAKGAKAAGARKITPGQSPDQVNAELQRRRKAAAARSQARKDSVTPEDSGEEPAASDPAPASSSAPKVPAGAMDVAHAGGGFALGLVTYVVVLTYIKGGAPAVKQLARAKLFNKTGA